ncbi:hypothetical protein H1R20_g9292, partial [Candolleomyces eurysporus]
MPPEPTKAKLKRRSSRKELDEYRFDGTHARELEMKRNRGEVSCAECRRLKIKCDKQIPCQSCQRRGCVALCPNGSLSTGQGTRFVLAATEHLHRKISTLSDRVRQLEDALSTLQAKHSTEPHPLLAAELVSSEDKSSADDDLKMRDETISGESSKRGGSGQASSSGSNTGEIIDAFGTLSVSQHGVSRFFGPTGGSESLLLSNQESPDFDLVTSGSPSLSPPLAEGSSANASTPESLRDSRSPASVGELSLFSSAFPFTPLGQPTDVQDMIETTHLPILDTALTLADTYFSQVAWLFRGLTKGQIIDDMLPIIYKQKDPEPGEDYSGPHDLALIFMVFAIGSLVAQDAGHTSAQAEHYYQISRAALSLQPVLEKPSLVTIQSLHLIGIYTAMSGSDRSDSSMEMAWNCITLAAHLSQTIGLHRDSARWGLSPKIVRRRRVLFWDLFVAETWQSLNTGRPPTFSLHYIDCSFPESEDLDNISPEKKMDSEYELWSFKFAAEVVAEVTARTLTAEAPTYTTIMELDRKVREFPLPESMRKAAEEEAIIDHPENPLKSAYAPSFLASYRASSTILKLVIEQFNVWPNSSARFWTMWTFAFTAAVVFGTVVTRGPRSPLAKSAMKELEQACVLFSKASMYSVRATKALVCIQFSNIALTFLYLSFLYGYQPILKKLNEKAHYALQAAQSDPSGDNGLHWDIKQEDTDDELAIFAGHTRFVSVKKGAGTDAASTPTVQQHPTSGSTGSAVSTPSSTSASIPPSTSSYQTGTGMFHATPVVPQPRVHSHNANPGFSHRGSYSQPQSTSTIPVISIPEHVPSVSPDPSSMDTSGDGDHRDVRGAARQWSSYGGGPQQYTYTPPEPRGMVLPHQGYDWPPTGEDRIAGKWNITSINPLHLRYHPRPRVPAIRTIITPTTTPILTNTNNHINPSFSTSNPNITRCTLRSPLLRLRLEALL